MTDMMIVLVFLSAVMQIALFTSTSSVHAFSVSPTVRGFNQNNCDSARSRSTVMSMAVITSEAAGVVSAATTSISSDLEHLTFLVAGGDGVESWRQYVPLVVSVGVIADILLGSPLANMVMAPLRGETGEIDEAGRNNSPEQQINKSKERVDSEQVAAEALAKASATLELRKFLDESKSDWQKMEEQKRELDKQMQELDADMARRQKDFDKRGSA